MLDEGARCGPCGMRGSCASSGKPPTQRRPSRPSRCGAERCLSGVLGPQRTSGPQSCPRAALHGLEAQPCGTSRHAGLRMLPRAGHRQNHCTPRLYHRGEPKALYSRDQREINGPDRQWCPGAESNHRHRDFQSRALPTELPGRPNAAATSRPYRRRPRALSSACPDGNVQGQNADASGAYRARRGG